jgi:hypothetical protein
MKESRIILFFVIFFIFSSLFLAVIGTQKGSPDYEKSWWSVYFSNPKSNDLAFVIENHSSETDFHWEVFIGKTAFDSGDLVLKIGEQKQLNPQMENKNLGKITIKISTKKTSKEIYKNL